jgi:ribA/ribD-fused uncharacterized protein
METHGLDTNEEVFFYEQEFYCLSNFSAFRVLWRGISFDTAEHAYHYEKFCSDYGEPISPSAAGMLIDICKARSAHDAFKIAERNADLVRPDWKRIRVDRMLGILRAKADQHEYVRRKLLETGSRSLIENSWRDDFWGWGPNKDGRNALGKLWMSVRDELIAASESRNS